jgi:selenocysteine lyase/cysteine desulfurase
MHGDSADDLFTWLREGVLGDRAALATPFGPRPLVYADYTASGRAFKPIEDFLQAQVLPFYANTHSESAFTGRQTHRFREEARNQIRAAVGAGPEHAVIFCGSGATGAINRLIDCLGLRHGSPGAPRPVVVLGPFEHHSNELPWRESAVDLRHVPLSAEGTFDEAALATLLKTLAPGFFASFSAASNVTGVRCHTQRISALVHEAGGRVFWDYAAAGPYVAIDASDKDAIFLSPHKFLGGPGTPGVLVVRKELLTGAVPAVPGGGTVSFVSPERHRYLQALERREEGGTPPIVETVRAGLAFALKEKVGAGRIEAQEKRFLARAEAVLGALPELRLLGPRSGDRLAILSFQIFRGAQPLHYGFVVALLNDLFGIQVRGGCSCAGPYAHHLLGISEADSHRFDEAIGSGHAVLRPGWVRMNFNYFLDEDSFTYLLDAVTFVAKKGYRFLPLYCYCPAEGRWIHRDDAGAGLSALASAFEGTALSPPRCDVALATFLAAAEAATPPCPERTGGAPACLRAVPEALRPLQWFYLPPT